MVVSFIQPHTCDLPRQQFGDLRKVKGDVVKIKHVDTEKHHISIACMLYRLSMNASANGCQHEVCSDYKTFERKLPDFSGSNSVDTKNETNS